VIPTPAIAPSILSSDFARLGEQIETVMDAGARVIHVDVMDGHFVPPITIGPLIVEAIRDLVKGRGGTLDVHLMIERPERHVEAFAKAGADVITIHPEATPNIHYGLKLIRDLGCRAGVVINPATPVSTLDEIAGDVDYVLVMSVNPGFGGQRFIPRSEHKVGAVRALLDRAGNRAPVEIDGGIDRQNVGCVVAAGAGIIVAGSAIFHSGDPERATRELKAAAMSTV